MINMSTVNSIRQQRRDGFSISDIAKRNGVSRDAISTSPKTTSPRGRPPSALDRYRPLIESWLDEDERNRRESTPTSLTLGGGNVGLGLLQNRPSSSSIWTSLPTAKSHRNAASYCQQSQLALACSGKRQHKNL